MMSEVRVCTNCGFHNNTNNLECEKCGYDLTFVIPVDEDALNTETTTDKSDTSAETTSAISCNLQLVSTDGQLTIPITNELVIGRDGINGSYFEKSNFVSRKHAVFYIENGEVLVFDASTNGTFINDKRIDKLTKTPVHISDKVTFADLIFEVKNAD